jgi:hypothetical protein
MPETIIMVAFGGRGELTTILEMEAWWRTNGGV